MSKKIVIALGGNAILEDDPSAEGQKFLINNTVKEIIPLVEQGYKIVISHGNGPQVGNLLLQQITANSTKNPKMPLDTLVAMTQGSIGYWLVQALNEQLQNKQIKREVAAIVTQVIVDPNDPSFGTPSKPIGPFYSKEEAQNLMAQENVTYKEDSGRGWRKVVASPNPINIKEAQLIKKLVDDSVIVIAAGGGGIPITESGSGLEAVIDKDFAAEKLAELVDADMFVILTGVDNVYVNYNKPNQQCLEHVSVSQLEHYISEKQFAPGSMLPKVEAANHFASSGENKISVITSISNLSKLSQKAGTWITR